MKKMLVVFEKGSIPITVARGTVVRSTRSWMIGENEGRIANWAKMHNGELTLVREVKFKPRRKKCVDG